ncbi:MAG: UDP-2,3-diacylglucosamine diphosphatase [Burkholderiales bacterium]|nr:MAG: UDP-2,3-diacylglucosamine diphosphatase [Betaproteobacteria bacterium TMED22]|tara:strand:+ start:17040 stop:17774 length:735 start_codon:yes stop_codon:yes gene_type:complete
MMDSTKFIFISDLHLSPSEAVKIDIFLRFLKRCSEKESHLFILGDLFDYWVGDDDIDNPLHQQILPALRALTCKGAKLSMMRGNRDFLISEKLSKLTDAAILPDPYVIELHGQRTLLSHGDQWCTDDEEYQAIRSTVRTNKWIDSFLKLPLPERHSRAKNYRQISETSKEAKELEIMDVSAKTVEDAFKTYNCQRIIHGHTHRHAHHEHLINTQLRERFVLSDWNNRGQALIFNESDYSDQFFT